jgi:hypothetical protein
VEGVLARHRLGGRDGMGSGVKVRAELDRVSGLALMPDPVPSTMWAGCRRSRAVRRVLSGVLVGLRLVTIGCVMLSGQVAASHPFAATWAA